jgi:hypothetical protein
MLLMYSMSGLSTSWRHISRRPCRQAFLRESANAWRAASSKASGQVPQCLQVGRVLPRTVWSLRISGVHVVLEQVTHLRQYVEVFSFVHLLSAGRF